jgi:hypothetical protein
MIELKITNSAALLLLTERMKIEFNKRKSANNTEDWRELNNLDFEEILEIAEAAAIDLICMLPADILLERNNLDEIIARAIRSLSGIYNKEEFNIYTIEKSRKLVGQIEAIFDKYNEESTFNYN